MSEKPAHIAAGEQSGLLTRRAFPLGALAALSITTAGCEQLLGYRIRYKMRLMAKTDEGSVVGEGVAETRVVNTSEMLSSFGGLSYDTRGQAAVVDLGAGQAVAALLRGYRTVDGRALPDYSNWEGWWALARFVNADTSWEDGRNPALRELSRLERSPSVALSGLALPMIVYFPDRLDPKSAVLLPPGGPEMDVPLPSVSMTVQLTSEPLFKERPELILPWAVASADQPSTYLTRDAERLRTPFDVTRGDIVREKSS